MELAHTLGTNGPEVELLILAGAMLVLGIVFFFQRSVKPMVPLILVLGAFVLAGGAFIFKSDDTTQAASIDATITIVSPEAGAEVPANEPFPLRVELGNASLTTANQSADPSEGHLHVYVDDELIAMPTDATPEVELEPGSHVITVEFTQADHRSFEPRILDKVEVTAQ